MSHLESRTLGWSVGIGRNAVGTHGASFGSVGFDVSESYTTGNSYNCVGKPGQTVCVTALVGYTDYTVQERVRSGDAHTSIQTLTSSMHPTNSSKTTAATTIRIVTGWTGRNGTTRDNHARRADHQQIEPLLAPKPLKSRVAMFCKFEPLINRKSVTAS